jgi:hypothetical protein
MSCWEIVRKIVLGLIISSVEKVRQGMVKVKISRSAVVSYRDGKVRRAIAHGEYEAVQLGNGDWKLSRADRMYVLDAADIPSYLSNRSLVRVGGRTLRHSEGRR